MGNSSKHRGSNAAFLGLLHKLPLDTEHVPLTTTNDLDKPEEKPTSRVALVMDRERQREEGGRREEGGGRYGLCEMRSSGEGTMIATQKGTKKGWVPSED